MSDYERWLTSVTGFTPHPWQVRMGDQLSCVNRLVRIPTGFGKTAGTVLPWVYRRIVCADPSWPTRLVFCLPMRTLVEQTETAIKAWLGRAGLTERVGVHVLMGGSDAGRPWRLTPEDPALLVGTQDMLLSRALNRAYGSGRAAWPIEFGLLNNDVLWVSDEIQLQDVGLATSAQLAAFRAQDDEARGGALRPSRTWWMSATLQPRWLETVDHSPSVPRLAANIERIPKTERKGGLWDVRKALRRELSADGPAKPADVAKLVLEKHVPGTLSLVIVNTVKRAAEVFDVLSTGQGHREKRSNRALPVDGRPELHLVHSRFRGIDRRHWATAFLSRDAPLPPTGGRIIVCTQVVEAGVDISAKLLITDLAPWPSLVQRFGRAARYEGEAGEILVVGGVPDEKQSRPYELPALEEASKALDLLVSTAADASPSSLEQFEEGLSEPTLQALYPYTPMHVLRRKDLDQLFDTSADLSGADIDISRFIRSGEERDVLAFWRDLPPDPSNILPVQRDEVCPVPIGDMKDWLNKKRRRAFRFDYLEGEWHPVDTSRLAPGTEVLIATDEGGYLSRSGWTPTSTTYVEPVLPTPFTASALGADALLERASRAEDEDALSEMDEWKTIAIHGKEAGEQVRQIGRALGLDATLRHLLDLAGRWHDVGKGHVVFQDAIKEHAREEAGTLGQSRELAKAPKDAWRRPAYPARRGFRHELASTIGLFEFLRRIDSDHPALLGRHREVFAAIGMAPEAVSDASRIDTADPLACEIVALDANAFDLLAWLVCTHHGKVRCVWSSTPKDQESGEDRIHGIRPSDQLPEMALATKSGTAARLPVLELSLSLAELGLGARFGASWGERVAGLLKQHGPFKLAYLEALLRAADVRASIQGGIQAVENRQ